MDSSGDRKKLNWRQACAILSCSRSHFYNLINSGKLPAIRMGAVKGVRVFEDDCIEYLKSCLNEKICVKSE